MSILRTTRALVFPSRLAVISKNGTRAIFGPTPINNSKNVSITQVDVNRVVVHGSDFLSWFVIAGARPGFVPRRSRKAEAHTSIVLPTLLAG